MEAENRAPAVAQPVVLVLASGRGERFAASGGTVHKLSALISGKTVLQHTLAPVRASGLPWHLEDAGHPGMGDSIAAAVRATANAPGWLVLPGDLPLIQPETLRAIAAALADCAVAVPVHHGERGHPVGFAAQCRQGLLALTGEQGAASVVREQAQQGRVRLVDVNDVGTVTDVDTVQDLDRAAQWLTARG
jgi:molybdenum cofactor cytidylyltransferase